MCKLRRMTADSDEGYLAASHGLEGHKGRGFNFCQGFKDWNSRRSRCAAQAEGPGALGVFATIDINLGFNTPVCL